MTDGDRSECSGVVSAYDDSAARIEVVADGWGDVASHDEISDVHRMLCMGIIFSKPATQVQIGHAA